MLKGFWPNLLWNSKHISRQLFQRYQPTGRFQWADLMTTAFLASRQPITSGHIIPQKYKNTHQSFRASSGFYPAEESSPFLLNALLAKSLLLCCPRSRVQNCILQQFKARKAETWAAAARHEHWIPTVTVNSAEILNIWLQVNGTFIFS